MFDIVKIQFKVNINQHKKQNQIIKKDTTFDLTKRLKIETFVFD